MTKHTTIGGRTVCVAAISGNVRNVNAELRLDGNDGYHKLIYINRGNGRCMIDGRTFGVSPNTLIFIPHGHPHRVEMGVNTHAYTIAIPHEKSISLPQKPITLPVQSTADISMMTQLFDTSLHEFNSGSVGALNAIESYIGLIHVQLERLGKSQENTTKITASDALMRRFSVLVEEKFRSGQPLEAFADELNVTTTHLTRVCKQLNGQSASHFLQDRVLSEARRLLLITNSKVQDIALSLGFTSAAYFSRFFTARTEMTPKQFRASRNVFRGSAFENKYTLNQAFKVAS